MWYLISCGFIMILYRTNCRKLATLTTEQTTLRKITVKVTVSGAILCVAKLV